jgi:hypothetical protein
VAGWPNFSGVTHAERTQSLTNGGITQATGATGAAWIAADVGSASTDNNCGDYHADGNLYRASQHPAGGHSASSSLTRSTGAAISAASIRRQRHRLGTRLSLRHPASARRRRAG